MFNDAAFIQEFADKVKSLNVTDMLEIGALSGELMDRVGATGIDIHPLRTDVLQADVFTYDPGKTFELVYSSGVMEHYSEEQAIEFVRNKARLSSRYVLTYVPHTDCGAYMHYKKTMGPEWQDEDDYTVERLTAVHEAAGLRVVDSGEAALAWAQRFGAGAEAGYLAYCLAEKT
jgi:hypothetical protein